MKHFPTLLKYYYGNSSFHGGKRLNKQFRKRITRTRLGSLLQQFSWGSYTIFLVRISTHFKKKYLIFGPVLQLMILNSYPVCPCDIQVLRIKQLKPHFQQLPPKYGYVLEFFCAACICMIDF